MACFTCHLSWTTSCGGCHLPIEANWRTSVHHYEGEETRNFATYNPQVAREDMFQLGRHQTSKGNIIAPIRSTSALILSSTNINRERIYVQQPPISASGFSSQAFAPHFPHTVRTTETKTLHRLPRQPGQRQQCDHGAAAPAGHQLRQLRRHARLGRPGGRLRGGAGHRMGRAAGGDRLLSAALRLSRLLPACTSTATGASWSTGPAARPSTATSPARPAPHEQFANIVQGTPDRVGCLQNRGEYMFVAQGRGGFRVYDIASIANKGFSERIVTAPVSPLGQDTHVALAQRDLHGAADQPADRARPQRGDGEDAASPQPTAAPSPCSRRIRSSASTRSTIMRWSPMPRRACTSSTSTRSPTASRATTICSRAVTWNENGVLDRRPPRHARRPLRLYHRRPPGLVVVDLDDPLHPRHVVTIPLTDARASALQFRYLWVTDAEGLKLFDVTDLDAPRAGALGDRAARRRAPRLSRPHLRLCRGRRRRAGHRQHHPARAAGRALADAELAFWPARRRTRRT